LNAQYKLLNERSHKLKEQDENIRKLDHDKTVTQTQKTDLELQITRMQESKSEVERRNESLRREIDLL
jgi:hypothetical protein